MVANPIRSPGSFSFPTHGGTAVSDFVLYYQSAYMATSSHYRLHVYDPVLQLEVINQLINPDHINTVFFNQYVPFFFPLVAPLAFAPMHTAYSVWYGLSLLAGVGGLILVSNDRAAFGKQDLITIIFAILACAPSAVTLVIGQTSWFLLCGFCLFYLALKNRRHRLAGVSLSLLTIKPQYAPLLFISAITAKRWQLLLACCVSELLLLGLAVLTVGWKNVIEYPSILLHAETTAKYAGVNPAGMVSLRGLLSHLLPQTAVVGIVAVMLLLAALLIFKIWRMTESKQLSYE